MKIGGLQKVSLIDYPGQISTVIFFKGCNFRCPFCFNRDLVLETISTIPQRTVLSYLKKRTKILDGVVLTGGESLLQPGLKELLEKIKKLGFKIKLDTNGSLPDQLQPLLAKKLIDYAAVDIKNTFDDQYSQTVGLKKYDPSPVKKTLNLLLKAKILFELRTTVVPEIHDQKTLKEMAKQLKKIVGSKKISWFWQNFQPQNCLDAKYNQKKSYSQAKLEKWLKEAKKHYRLIELRSH